jgi:hypothetical protein
VTLNGNLLPIPREKETVDGSSLSLKSVASNHSWRLMARITLQESVSLSLSLSLFLPYPFYLPPSHYILLTCEKAAAETIREAARAIFMVTFLDCSMGRTYGKQQRLSTCILRLWDVRILMSSTRCFMTSRERRASGMYKKRYILVVIKIP